MCTVIRTDMSEIWVASASFSAMFVRTGYARSESIPYRWALLDSWWYGEYAHNGSGMYSWDESSAKEPVKAGVSTQFVSTS